VAKHKRRRRSAVRRPGLARSAHWIGRIAGLVVIVPVLVAGVALLALATAYGWQPLVVQSGSMGAAAPTGSVVLVKPVAASKVDVNDLLVIQNEDGGGSKPLVLHRVIDRTTKDGQIVVRTKGDANPTADALPHVLPSRNFTAALVLPRLGYVIAWLKSPLGWLTLTAVAATLVFFRSLRRIRSGATAGSAQPAQIA